MAAGSDTQRSDVDQQPTWGQYVRRYRQSKSVAPFEYGRPDYVTHYAKSREARKYDPILQKHTDVAEENVRKDKEAKIQVDRLNRARDNQLKTENAQNIINHQDRRPGISQEKPEEYRVYRADTRLDYHIISNLPMSEHSHLPPEQRMEVSWKPKPRTRSKYDRQRDFNIISNRYHQYHDAKSGIDQEYNRKGVLAKYWDTHNFNALTNTYYDPGEERDQKKQEERNLEIWGLQQLNNFPPSYKKSEGMAYNVTSGAEKDKELCETLDNRWAGARLRKSKKIHMEHVLTNRGVVAYDKSVQASQNRISHDRYQSEQSHGFNIVTGLDHRGRASQPPPPPRTKPKPSSWDSLVKHAEMQGGSAGYFGGLSDHHYDESVQQARQAWQDLHLNKNTSQHGHSRPPAQPRPQQQQQQPAREGFNRSLQAPPSMGMPSPTRDQMNDSMSSGRPPAMSGGRAQSASINRRPVNLNASLSDGRPSTSNASPMNVAGGLTKVKVTPLKLPASGSDSARGPYTPASRPDALSRTLSSRDGRNSARPSSVRSGGFQRMQERD
eukprot:GFYU01011488.1.p1 GENE.GFYU01011488.1~~GFYU01011488.1.p1  ORF type:complete len:552 (+),score=84.26 GFYU01011488.1:284-1939(+)